MNGRTLAAPMTRNACLAFVLAASVACSGSTDRNALRVSRGTFTSVMTLTGELEAKRGITISVPRLPNWETTVKWMVEDGTFVRAGERVVELDAGQLPGMLDTTRQQEMQAIQELQQRDSEWSADLQQKQLEMEKKNADLEKARMQAAVPRDLLAPREFEQRQLAFQKAEAELGKARELFTSQRSAIETERANLSLKIEKSRREIRRSSGALESLFLRAPSDGIFVVRELPWESRSLRVGDRVWVGFPLGSMPDLDSLQVSVALPDVDDGRIAPGMEAWVTLDGYPRERFHGKVTSVSAVAQDAGRNSQRRFFRAVVMLDRVDSERMRPGLSARVEVVREHRVGVLLAQREALRFEGAKVKAVLADGATKDVRVGSCNASTCVVVAGLEEGDVLRSFEENPGA